MDLIQRCAGKDAAAEEDAKTHGNRAHNNQHEFEGAITAVGRPAKQALHEIHIILPFALIGGQSAPPD
jgi:sorbitol-specific phosphotransferase system component IIA